MTKLISLLAAAPAKSSLLTPLCLTLTQLGSPFSPHTFPTSVPDSNTANPPPTSMAIHQPNASFGSLFSKRLKVLRNFPHLSSRTPESGRCFSPQGGPPSHGKKTGKKNTLNPMGDFQNKSYSTTFYKLFLYTLLSNEELIATLK